MDPECDTWEPSFEGHLLASGLLPVDCKGEVVEDRVEGRSTGGQSGERGDEKGQLVEVPRDLISTENRSPILLSLKRPSYPRGRRLLPGCCGLDFRLIWGRILEALGLPSLVTSSVPM